MRCMPCAHCGTASSQKLPLPSAIRCFPTLLRSSCRRLARSRRPSSLREKKTRLPNLDNTPDDARKGSRHSWVQRCIVRSEEHTSELQSPCNFVCRLLLEKKLNNRRQQVTALRGQADNHSERASGDS